MTGKQRTREILAKLTVDWEHSQTSTVIDQALDSIEEIVREVLGGVEDRETYFSELREWEVPEPLEADVRNRLRSEQLGRWESK